MVHEIVLNPAHFRERSDEDVLSTLTHEMTHLEQEEFGKPTRGYNNEEFAELLRRIGIKPSSTGEPGGRPTGRKMSHYVVADGPFARACAELLNAGVQIRYGDRVDEGKRAKKAASKTKYSCLTCRLNAWAKPDVTLVCGVCLTAGVNYVMVQQTLTS